MAIQSIIFIFFAFLYNFVIGLKIFKRIGYVQQTLDSKIFE